MDLHTAVAPVVEHLLEAVVWLPHGIWRFVGGTEHRSHYVAAVAVCSQRGDGQTRMVAAQSGAVEGPVEWRWIAEGVHWDWSRARWEDGGDNGSCFCLCCYWASRALHAPQAWRASVALGVLAVVAPVAVAAPARVSHCDIETFSGAPQSAALLCRLPCCATIAHLRS